MQHELPVFQNSIEIEFGEIRNCEENHFTIIDDLKICVPIIGGRAGHHLLSSDR